MKTQDRESYGGPSYEAIRLASIVSNILGSPCCCSL
jgi:hypothetical protein